MIYYDPSNPVSVVLIVVLSVLIVKRFGTSIGMKELSLLFCEIKVLGEDKIQGKICFNSLFLKFSESITWPTSSLIFGTSLTKDHSSDIGF